jgi:signal transduction histidine kinase/Na+/proline symporter/ActR/RegA family two-component response regulator
MLNEGLVLAAAVVWLGLLFGAAVWGERHPDTLSRHWGVVFALSLAVYCTSWTFMGTVQQARNSGWALPPTFLGTIALYALAFPVLLKLFRLARELNTTSIADLIATRLGRSSALAATVTAIAVVGMVPYLALQLKAVAMSHGLLTRGNELATPAWQDSALYVAITMAAFAMLFGTRRASAIEHNRGLVLAMAVESLLKLAAMLGLGLWLLWRPESAAPEPLPHVPGGTDGFPALILLGGLAMVTLPHQFHVGFVEGREESHLRTARWLFPLYLVLMALPVLALAKAGESALGALGVPADLYVLALPLAEGERGIALLAFLGGLSAATGMLVLATLTLSVMIGNHWLTPLRARGGWRGGQGDLRGAVLRQRQFGIAAVLLLAWAYSRALGDNEALADIGALSFSGLATLAPAVGFALWRPQTPPWAVLIGLLSAFAVWAWVLLLPSMLTAFGQGLEPGTWLDAPLGIAALSPTQFLGLEGWSPLGRGVAASLLVGMVLPLMLAAWTPAARAEERGALDAGAVERLASRFLPQERLALALRGARKQGALEPVHVERVERELAAVVGASSARLLLDALRHPGSTALEQVAELVDGATQDLRFNQQLLEVALEHMSQGISVVDRELRLVVWNRRYRELFDYPAEFLQVGMPVASLVEHNLRRGLAGQLDVSEALQQRLAHMRAGTPYLSERRIGESIIEIRGEPMPDGGFVATFTDVTAFRANEDALRRNAETLEQRVDARTQELGAAKAESERANQAKTRFLAAVSHDLTQPLHAARLFTHALAQRTAGNTLSEPVAQIEGALASAETLLSGLLDISRLDAGGLQAQPEDIALQPLLESLAREAGVLAETRGLTLRCMPTALWVHSDPQLLRRVLQNFLANAVRYTKAGGIVLGARRSGANGVRIEVWDTGPGIAPDQQRIVFEEFRRLQRGGQGLGLGLAIADRLASLLQAPLSLRSRPEKGSVFAITLPRAAARLAGAEPMVAVAMERERLALRVLVVDNEPSVLTATQQLLESWGAEVRAAATPREAKLLATQFQPEAWLLDFHLDDGATGDALHQELAAMWPDALGLIVSADHSEAVRLAVVSVGATPLSKPLKPLRLKTLLRGQAAKTAAAETPIR